jgi:tRNA/rRNA methyltransferase
MALPAPQPCIILVRPQLVENIGAVARAMLNCGLTELRLVAPRDGWPIASAAQAAPPHAPMPDCIAERLFAAASGADMVLRQAQVFPDLPTALADLHFIYATSARDHAMVKPWSTPRTAMPMVQQRLQQAARVGILFGPERTGLTHEDMTYANEAICIPTNPAFSSLNLAQAVLVLGYEWHHTLDAPPKPRALPSRPCTQGELHGLFNRLEHELDTAGFFTTPELRPTLVRNLRHALQRAQLTDQEVRTWHGVVTALAEGPKRRKVQP